MKFLRGHSKTGLLRRLALTAGFATLVIPLGAGAFGGNAQAAVGPCRSDPVVVLNNLKVLDLSAVIDDDQSDLQSVSYTLDLPAGVYPIVVVPTDGLVGQVEHFSYTNDGPAGKYTETTEAYTGSNVAVTATALNLLLGSGLATGYSNQPITIQL